MLGLDQNTMMKPAIRGWRIHRYRLRSVKAGGVYGRSRKASQAWRSDELHLAHAALTGVAEGSFATAERLTRAGLARSILVKHPAYSMRIRSAMEPA